MRPLPLQTKQYQTDDLETFAVSTPNLTSLVLSKTAKTLSSALFVYGSELI
jgi:hypothetical protein